MPLPHCESCRLAPQVLVSCGGCKKLVCPPCWETVCRNHGQR